MKELSIEQKAKRYDEAIKRAKPKIKNDKDHVLYKDDIIEIFPELKESEDERIKKVLLDFFRNELKKRGDEEWDYGFHTTDVIAWVEKQRSQILTNSSKTCKDEQNTVVVIPKFRVGDVIRLKGSTAEYTIESIYGECYHGNGWGLHISCDDDYELVEQKPASWNEEDEKMLKEIISDVKFEGYNNDMQANSYRKINWLKSLKDRVQPKQEWSEEDDDELEELLNYCDTSIQYNGIKSLQAIKWKKRKEWLKTLRPQNTWKPSDEMMKCLDNVKGSDDHNGYVLNTLYNDLKKLKEE